MSERITITLPAIDETIIEQIKAESTTTHETETAAIAVLREKYVTLAKQNGYIRTGYMAGGNSNFQFEHTAYLRGDGNKRVKALLCVDKFDTEKTSQNDGIYIGRRLYLTSDGEWISIRRTGSWSQWQGSTDKWTCGDVTWDDGVDESYDEMDQFMAGSVDSLDDAQVAAQYKLADIVRGLSESLTTMAEKLPERLTRVRERAALASQLLDVLKK